MTPLFWTLLALALTAILIALTATWAITLLFYLAVFLAAGLIMLACVQILQGPPS